MTEHYHFPSVVSPAPPDTGATPCATCGGLACECEKAPVGPDWHELSRDLGKQLCEVGHENEGLKRTNDRLRAENARLQGALVIDETGEEMSIASIPPFFAPIVQAAVACLPELRAYAGGAGCAEKRLYDALRAAGYVYQPPPNLPTTDEIVGSMPDLPTLAEVRGDGPPSDAALHVQVERLAELLRELVIRLDAGIHKAGSKCECVYCGESVEHLPTCPVRRAREEITP